MEGYSYRSAGEAKALLRELVRMTYETVDWMEVQGLDSAEAVEQLMDMVARLRTIKGRFDLAFSPSVHTE